MGHHRWREDHQQLSERGAEQGQRDPRVQAARGVRSGRPRQHWRRQEPGEGRQDDSIQEDRSTYMLKMKTSREFFSGVSKCYGSMPFNIRNCEEEKKARMGVVECVKHQVLQPFNVLYEKEG